MTNHDWHITWWEHWVVPPEIFSRFESKKYCLKNKRCLWWLWCFLCVLAQSFFDRIFRKSFRPRPFSTLAFRVDASALWCHRVGQLPSCTISVLLSAARFQHQNGHMFVWRKHPLDVSCAVISENHESSSMFGVWSLRSFLPLQATAITRWSSSLPASWSSSPSKWKWLDRLAKKTGSTKWQSKDKKWNVFSRFEWNNSMNSQHWIYYMYLSYKHFKCIILCFYGNKLLHINTMLCYAYIYTCYLHSMQKSSCLVQLILWMKCRQDSQSRSPGWSFDGRIGGIKFKEEKVVRTKNPRCWLLPQLWDLKQKFLSLEYFMAGWGANMQHRIQGCGDSRNQRGSGARRGLQRLGNPKHLHGQ